MTLVIDASVIVAARVDTGKEGHWGESLIADELLTAPEPVIVEATNVLRRLELAKEISSLASGLTLRDLVRAASPRNPALVPGSACPAH